MELMPFGIMDLLDLKKLSIAACLVLFASGMKSKTDRYRNLSSELDDLKIELSAVKDRLNILKGPKKDNSKKEDEFSTKHKICFTKECIESSYELLKNMDLNVDPCDDFYKFSCGRYIKESIMPEDKTRITAITPLRDISMKFNSNHILNNSN